MKNTITFRPDIWLREDIKNYAALHQLVVPATGEFAITKTMHEYIRALKDKATEYDKLAKDINIYRSYAEKLAKEIKPFRCGPLGEVSILECYQCQTKTKENPTATPQDVRDCPRNKPLGAM